MKFIREYDRYYCPYEYDSLEEAMDCAIAGITKRIYSENGKIIKTHRDI